MSSQTTMSGLFLLSVLALVVTVVVRQVVVVHMRR